MSRKTKSDPLLRGLSLSLIGHLGLIAMVWIKSAFFLETPRPYIPSLKVDLVALPDLQKKEARMAQLQPPSEVSKLLKQAEESAKRIQTNELRSPKQQPIKPNQMAILPKPVPKNPVRYSDRNRLALHRLKSLSSIERLKESLEKEESPAPVRGNKLSPGLSTSSDARESTEGQYGDILKDMISSNFNLPTWLRNSEYSARVKVYLDAQGRLTRLLFVSPSGNPQFDEAVRRAIQESQPFPPPPEQYRPIVFNEGVLLGFPL